MTLTDQQQQEFEALARPLIEWLRRNCHPHVSVILDGSHAELLEGVASVNTNTP